ncbi:hypothetical protein FB451DRAFT_1358968 [Mycena latifolia]|nr:hypothetical protein FB451DRAFT_1358968 [Mycena latifolia]
MFKLFIFRLFCTLLLGTVPLIGASPDSAPPVSLGRRDIFSFYATQNWLQFMANTFGQDSFSTPDGVAKLQIIANHIKNCSDAFDSATIQLASLIPAGQFSPMISPSDAAILNTTFVPSTQGTILGHLHTLLFGKAFFEAVNGSPQMRIVICHWVGDLARENDIFLSQIASAAPSSGYSSYWNQLRTSAAAG